jgi:protein-disulfide isomerase
MSELTSAAVPPIGSDDHVTGEGPESIVYADLGCPYCAAAWARIRELPLRLCFRHFPMASKHPRAPALHAAAEAAGLQGSFWQMCDSLYADRGRVDDPHLWERAERFGLDLERFNADRRSEAVRERIDRDFVSGIRAGVGGTPTGFVEGRRLHGNLVESLAELTTG